MSGRHWIIWCLLIVLGLIVSIILVQGAVFVPSADVVGA